MKKKQNKKVVIKVKGVPKSTISSLLDSNITSAFVNGFGTNLLGAEAGRTLKKRFFK